MESMTIAEILRAVLDPAVIGGAAVVTLAFLSGAVARFVELLHRS